MIIDSIADSPYLNVTPPAGAMYAFVGVDKSRFPGFDDQAFALDLLEKKHVLVAPGTSFNTRDSNFFRITNLPDADMLKDVFVRIQELLDGYVAERTA